MTPTSKPDLGPVGVWLGSIHGAPAAREREAAAEIEALGYGALWFGEAHVNKEALAHAGLLLAATERLAIATGIASVWARDATAAQNGASTLGEAYPGRFVLGLGIAHVPTTAPRGHDYGKPIATMRAYLDAMDAAASAYAGPAPDPAVPVVLAALRPRMLELARDRTAGAHPYFTTVEHTARARELLGPDALLAPELAFVLETDPARARELARGYSAMYLQLPNYLNHLRTLGYDDADFADGGSDRLIDDVIAWGDADAIRARIAAYHEAGADHVPIQPITGDARVGLEELRALAPTG